jgi:hypothetical protein
VRGCEQCTGRDRSSTLDVVVERAQPVAIAFEDAPGIGAGEIFPLQQYMRPASFHCRDELLHKVIVIGTADALVPPSDINRIGEALAIVDPGVEQYGQGRRRMQAGASGVERELADRDAHAARTLIARPNIRSPSLTTIASMLPKRGWARIFAIPARCGQLRNSLRG